ncbi:MAG: alpha/beta hydrolase [Spirochaetia bacterium]|nr:alpha/beta hydrolase [Spirochaetia bacterium]
MKNKINKNVIITLILLFSFIQCASLLDDKYQEGDFFYLENKGAVMPVWVKGNQSSGVYVIFLHGGPGNSSDTYSTAHAYNELGKKYAFVFWDQRASGASQGNPDLNTFTLAQFADDTKKIVNLIRHMYKPNALFLVGKSWGGAIGSYYLSDPQNQQLVNGWIEIDGAHNLKDGIPLSWEWAKDNARKRIAAGDEVEFWQEEIAWYNSKPANIDTDYFMRHGSNLNKLNGIYKNPALDPGDTVGLFAPVPFFFYQLNAYYLNNDNQFDIKNIKLNSLMANIQIPSMVLWGRHDGTLPVELAQDAYDALGTPVADKSLYIFENSAHCPSFEETSLFILKMQEFIELYR